MNINMKKGVLAGDIRLREALNLAIDRELYVAKINPLGQLPAYSINPPILSNYTTQSMPMKDMPQSERIARAKELVAAAGYSPENPLKLTVDYPTQESTRQILLAFRQMLLPIGIDLTLNNMEWQVFVGLVNDRNFDIGILGSSGAYDDYENGLDNYRGDANDGNYSAYNNPVFDDLFHRGGTATDINVRRDLMQQAERTMLADFPIVPISFTALNRVVNPQLVGVLDGTRFPQSRYLSFKNTAASQ
jgi:oligopeptide transport system substrate-binding protein